MDGETHKSRQRLPFFRPRGATNRVPEGQTGSSLGSVGAYWPLSRRNTASHRCCMRPGHRALPSARSRPGRGAECLLTLPSERIKNRVPGGHPSSHGQHDSLRWHDPHQVKGRSVSFLSARAAGSLSFALYYGPGGGFVKKNFRTLARRTLEGRRRPSVRPPAVPLGSP